MCGRERILGSVADRFGVLWVWGFDMGVLCLGGVREGSEWSFFLVLEYVAISLESLGGRSVCYCTYVLFM